MVKDHDQCIAEERALLLYELVAIIYWIQDRENKNFAGNNLGRVRKELSDLKESEHRNQPLNI